MGNSLLLYLLILIPAAAVIFCSIKFPNRVNIWERMIIFVIPLILIICVKFTSSYTQTRDTEYWNKHIVSAEYHEYWSTWDEQTCTRCVSRDTSGNCTREERYDCSECDEHPRYFKMIDNDGNNHSIDERTYRALVKEWSNETFVDQNRHINTHWGCGKDGDVYVTRFDGVVHHVKPVCEQHSYENRVQCSKSLYNFEDVDSADIAIYGLYRFPDCGTVGGSNYNIIQGDNNPAAAKLLGQYNGLMGKRKQVHMMILVFNDKPRTAYLKQRAYWKNGNKNEFTLCIGRKGDRITWAEVLSWTEEQELKIRLSREVRELPKYDLLVIVDMMAKEVGRDFERKHFADFNYLTVEPTNDAVLFAFILTLLSTFGICLFAVLNRFHL